MKRLGTLIGFTFFWLIAALALPIVFWIIGGLILGGTMLHMVLEKDGFGPGHRFFTIVSGVTLLLATAGFFVGGDEEPATDEATLAAVDDALALDDEDEEVDEDTDAGEARAAAEDAFEAMDEDAEAHAAPVDVAAALKVANVAKKGKGCKSLETIAAAWQELSRVPTDDEQFKKAKKAAAALEKCRKKATHTLLKGAAKTRAKERVALAKELGKLLAEAGVKLKGKPAGKAKNKVTFKGKKITAEKIDEAFSGGATDEGTILGRLQAAGFAKVAVAAGKVKKSWDLEPEADDAAAVAQIEELGLAEPIAF